jgi:endoglucanase
MLALVITVTACTGDTNGDSAPPGESLPFNDISAFDIVNDIKIGWNLGDSLDCHFDIERAVNAPVTSLEIVNNPPVTKANIDMIKYTGFNAIRIPVSWYKAIDDDYNIRDDWMKRVTQVVNFAALNDFYIIINSRNDQRLFMLADEYMQETEKAFVRIWEQIAENFKNYDEKLIFEALNMPRSTGGADEWSGNGEGYKNLNKLNQLFVDTVRSSGGNNDNRILMVTTYASSASESAISSLTIPNDSAINKIIVSFNGYIPSSFTRNIGGGWSNIWSKNFENDTIEIIETLDRIENLLVNKGIPVIISEFGATNRNNLESRVEWTEFFVSQARERGIPCFWWDNGLLRVTSSPRQSFGLLDRETNEFRYREIVEALLRGAAG